MNEMTIYEAHQKLKKKEISSYELTQECLKKALVNDHNAFISINEELALEESKSIEDFPHYLSGIPYSLKDIFLTRDIRTTAGSLMLTNYIPQFDGFVAEKLKEKKGVLVGKNSMDEFAMGSSNEYTPFGVVKNPLDSQRVPGGSSGGSAASVCEGSSFFSMGTDTGGSVRLPAHFCGLVGFKPSYGRISRFGQMAFASSLDQAAPFTRSVLDQAILYQVLSEKDERDATSVGDQDTKNLVEEMKAIESSFIKGKKIGFVPEHLEAVEADVQKSLREVKERLEKAGAEFVPISLPHTQYAVSVYYLIAPSEASANLARYDGIHYGYREKASGLDETYALSRDHALGAEVKKRILLGTFSLSAGYFDAYYMKACKVRKLMANDFARAFKECDVIFSPVSASIPPKIGERCSDTLQMYMNDLYTIPANLAGLPGLSLPYKGCSTPFQIGPQFIGKQFDDQFVLKFSHAVEKLLS